MPQKCFLSELLPGEYATVLQNVSRGEHKRRLEDLGLTKGCSVSCVFSASAGDPVAYRVRGTLLALRKKDAGKIWVKKGGDIYANKE